MWTGPDGGEAGKAPRIYVGLSEMAAILTQIST